MLAQLIGPRLGEAAGLATALFWTVTVLCFEIAGKRVGTLSLNLIRLTFGFLFLTLFSLFSRGMLLPLDAPPSLWFWLFSSGFVGFVMGDILLFQAFIEIGARVSMLIYSAVPPLSALLGWVVLGEKIGLLGYIGMAVTLGGISLVILEREGEPSEGARPTAGDDSLSRSSAVAPPKEESMNNSAVGPLHEHRKPKYLGAADTQLRFRHPIRGVLLAFGGALGQAVGLILSKHGAPSYNPFSATQIRCMAGILGFTLVILATRRLPMLRSALRDKVALRIILLGSFFGPFLGVSLSLLSIQHTSTGVASTLMGLVPVLVIWPSHFLFGEPIRLREVVGALIAVGGTVILFIH